jgi:hypothetical protein
VSFSFPPPRFTGRDVNPLQLLPARVLRVTKRAGGSSTRPGADRRLAVCQHFVRSAFFVGLKLLEPLRGLQNVPVHLKRHRNGSRLEGRRRFTPRGVLLGSSTRVSGVWRAGDQSSPWTPQRMPGRAQEDQRPPIPPWHGSRTRSKSAYPKIRPGRSVGTLRLKHPASLGPEEKIGHTRVSAAEREFSPKLVNSPARRSSDPQRRGGTHARYTRRWYSGKDPKTNPSVN